MNTLLLKRKVRQSLAKDMKIWYKKITRSVNIDEVTLFSKIHTALDKADYDAVNLTPHRIKFKYDIWLPGFRHIAFRHIDGGIFELSQEVNKELSFSYYISPISELLTSLIAVIFGVYQHEYTVCVFFPSFIAIGFGIRAIVIANQAVNMMDDILPEHDETEFQVK